MNGVTIAMILTDETRNTWRNISPSVTSYTTNPTWTGLVLKPGLVVDMSAPNRLSNCTACYLRFLKCWLTGLLMNWSEGKKSWPILRYICLRIRLPLCHTEIWMRDEELLIVIPSNLGFLFHLNPIENVGCNDNREKVPICPSSSSLPGPEAYALSCTAACRLIVQPWLRRSSSHH
jgi:hypothetical protein